MVGWLIAKSAHICRVTHTVAIIATVVRRQNGPDGARAKAIGIGGISSRRMEGADSLYTDYLRTLYVTNTTSAHSLVKFEKLNGLALLRLSPAKSAIRLPFALTRPPWPPRPLLLPSVALSRPRSPSNVLPELMKLDIP